MVNSADDDSSHRECPSMVNSSNSGSGPTVSVSSNLASPNLENPVMADSSHQPSPEPESPAIENSLDQASSKQDSPTVVNSSNQPSADRKRPAISSPLDQASPKLARIANADAAASVTEDRISLLPDRALIRILEQLPLTTAIMVSRLSRRWFRLWTWMSKLSFDQYSHPAFEDFSNFSSFVDAALLLCHPNLVRSISIIMRSKSDHHRKLPIWLGFVDNNNVKELDLKCGTCELPASLCFNSCIVKLKLRIEELKIPIGVYWRSLRCLSLDGICFPDNDMMVEILAGCPLLEELEMDGCSGVLDFDFTPAVSLKKFSMIDDMDEPNVDICCGNLQSLVIYCSFHVRMYYLHDPSFLREVVLRANDISVYSKRIDVDNYAKDIICSLTHVGKLTLVGSCLELFAYCNDRSLPSPLPTLRNLVLSIHFSELDMLGLAAMLRSCPNLMTLTIELNDCLTTMCGSEFVEDIENELEPMETYWKSQDISAFKCLYMNLKTVKVTRFGLYDCEECNLLQFLEFILKNALMLEQLMVTGEKEDRDRDKAEERLVGMAQTLLSFKRSSPFVNIIFN